MWVKYIIWRKPSAGSEWFKTTRSLKARTDEEAQSKMLRMYKHAGFSSMALIALLEGETPIAR